jgi:methylated-DNA-[protein]-cysteine S-methyltransferase
MIHKRCDFVELPIATADGEFTAHYSEDGLCGLDFPGGERARKDSAKADEAPEQIRRWHAAASEALKRALAGQPAQNLPPLDLSAGTGFQQEVWQALGKISCGKTSSYGQVAQTIGRPKAVRAVGMACGANPIPVFVPCHRVVAAGRRLGGFSADLNWKRTLLQREGTELID